MPSAYSWGTLKVFAFTPKILVQLDTLCPLMVFFPSTGSSLKLVWCLPIVTLFFPNSNTMTSYKISSTHKCQSINHREVRPPLLPSEICTCIASVHQSCCEQNLTRTCFFSAVTFFNQSES